MDAGTISGRRRLDGLEWTGNDLGNEPPTGPRLSFDLITSPSSNHYAQSFSDIDLTRPYRDITEISLSSSSSCNAAYTDFTGAGVPTAGLFEDSCQMTGRLPWPVSLDGQEQGLLAIQDSCWRDGFPQAMFAMSPPLSAGQSDNCGPPVPVSTTFTARDGNEILGERGSDVKARHRRQNRSCDPCRTSKRGCDLPRGVTVRDSQALAPCTSCKNRELKCTVSWLARRRLVRQDECWDAQSGPGRVERADKAMTSSLLVEDFPRKVLAETTCYEKFNEYIYISDSFLSHCLLRESMPLQYRFGVAAYDSLSKVTDISSHVQRAERWTASCWDGGVVAEKSPGLPRGPRILQVAGLLDALFMSAVAGSPRDAAITEAFKWVGIATGAQLTLNKAKENHGHDESAWKHGIAVFAWRKAKDLIFANISATSSFRLALALVFFGNIAPPMETTGSGMAEEYADDREFALCEGLRRLCTLCCKAREEVNVRRASPSNGGPPKRPLQMLSDQSLQLLLELIGSLEWLACIFNSVTISTTLGRLRPFSPDADGLDEGFAGSPSSLDGMTSPDGDATAMILASAPPHMSQNELAGPILGKAKQRTTSLCEFWRTNLDDIDAVMEAGRLPMALSSLSWIFLARFTLAAKAIDGGNPAALAFERIRRHYMTMHAIIGLWRTTFGTLDHTMRTHLQNSKSDIWRLFSFCTFDTDFAILLFCDATQRLEKRLNELQHVPEQDNLLHALQKTSPFRAKQRLTSAGQIAVVSSTCQDPNITGRPRTDHAQTRHMLAHPVSRQ